MGVVSLFHFLFSVENNQWGMKRNVTILIRFLLFLSISCASSISPSPAKGISSQAKNTLIMNLNQTITTKSFLPTASTPPAAPPPPPPRNMAYIWSSLFAGVGSGALASVVCAPLDLLRTRMQVWGDVGGLENNSNKGAGGAFYFLSRIRHQEGFKGYFRGLGATLATVPMFWGLYFPLYDEMKRSFSTGTGQDGKNSTTFLARNPSLLHCLSAISAGAVADVLCNPMFVVRTRLQTEALHSNRIKTIRQTVKELYLEGGILIFWRGLAASILGLSHVGVQFPVYEFLKKEARLIHNGVETPLDLLLASALSKMTASLLTYPHEVIRSRMMDARVASDASFGKTCARILEHEGLTGFYSGLHVSLIRVIPNCCVTFLTYELLLRFAKENLC